MNTWFRFYAEALNDPKVQRLPPELFKAWVNLLCLACNGDGNVTGDVSEISFALRVPEEVAAQYIDDLVSAGLIDDLDDTIKPHNWDKRQFKSDTSNERVKKHREKKRNVTQALPVTDPEQNRTETETDNIRLISPSASQPKPPGKRASVRLLENPRFEEFWSAYPRRDGSNPRQPASEKFSRFVSAGIEPDEIINGARRYSAECERNATEGRFVAQATTWLNQQRWKDYGAPGVAQADGEKVPVFASDAEFDQWWQSRKVIGNG